MIAWQDVLVPLGKLAEHEPVQIQLSGRSLPQKGHLKDGLQTTSQVWNEFREAL